MPIKLSVSATVTGPHPVGCLQLRTRGTTPTKVLMAHNGREICVCGPIEYAGPTCGQLCAAVLLPLPASDSSISSPGIPRIVGAEGGHAAGAVLSGALPVTLGPGARVVYRIWTTATPGGGLVRAASVGPGPGALFVRLADDATGATFVPVLVGPGDAEYGVPEVELTVTMPSWARAASTTPLRHVPSDSIYLGTFLLNSGLHD